jgi:hypothetical protein
MFLHLIHTKLNIYQISQAFALEEIQHPGDSIIKTFKLLGGMIKSKDTHN